MVKTKFVSKKRSVDKNITSFNLSITNPVQTGIDIMTAGADAARTFNGGIISGSFRKNIVAANGRGFALLVVVRDGDTVNLIDHGNNVVTYKPEENVLWGRAWDFTGDAGVPITTDSLHFMDTIKTKRILKNGDSLRLLVAGNIANLGSLVGMITHFYKL